MSDSTLYNALTESRTAYKVVTRENGRAFRPATLCALQSFRYRIGEETRQDPSVSGPMAVFETLEQAKRFMARYGDAILLVEYEPAAENRVWKRNPPRFRKNKWDGDYYPESNGISERTEFPAGTILAKSVYPLEVVEMSR